jgi:Leucine-rich repeat (LRR) protein
LQDLIGLDELAILDLSDCPVSNFQPLKDLPELYQLTAKDLGDKELQQLNEMLPKLVVIR